MCELGTRDQNVELMGHPPYSSDLAPNDFFLFPHIKKKLRGQWFSLREDDVEAFKCHVLEVSQSEWKKYFDKWFERMMINIRIFIIRPET